LNAVGDFNHIFPAHGRQGHMSGTVRLDVVVPAIGDVVYANAQLEPFYPDIPRLKE
jgi:hypothetical protein